MNDMIVMRAGLFIACLSVAALCFWAFDRDEGELRQYRFVGRGETEILVPLPVPRTLFIRGAIAALFVVGFLTSDYLMQERYLFDYTRHWCRGSACNSMGYNFRRTTGMFVDQPVNEAILADISRQNSDDMCRSGKFKITEIKTNKVENGGVTYEASVTCF